MVTDLVVVAAKESLLHTSVNPLIAYCLLFITLVVGSLYATKRYDLGTKLRNRLQSRQDWDRLPIFVTFQR